MRVEQKTRLGDAKKLTSSKSTAECKKRETLRSKPILVPQSTN